MTSPADLAVDFDEDGNPLDEDGNIIEEPSPPAKENPSALRNAVKRANAAKEKAQAEALELRKENALYKAGLTDLDGRKVTALLAAHEGDLTPDLLRATAVTLGFAEPPDTTEQEAADQAVRDSAETQARQSAAAAGAAPGATGQITVDTYRDWPMDKRLQFQKDHPTAAEQLRRGDPVPAIAGY